MLKETGARCGEIWWLKWEEIDFDSKVVNITPEKNSNSRVIRLSNKVLNMLQVRGVGFEPTNAYAIGS
jgi:integrase